jgi:xanthine dehydrogenase accessory factor
VIESFDVAEVERTLGGLGGDDYALIITRDHAIDQRLLETLIVHDELHYLGMIGSLGKVGRFRKRLEAKGIVTDDDVGAARWARLHAPIGLDLGSETPEEIAISIVAQLVALRRRGGPSAGDWIPQRQGSPR